MPLFAVVPLRRPSQYVYISPYTLSPHIGNCFWQDITRACKWQSYHVPGCAGFDISSCKNGTCRHLLQKKTWHNANVLGAADGLRQLTNCMYVYIYIYISSLKLRMPRSFPKYFTPNLECLRKTAIFSIFLGNLECLAVYFHILGRGILSCHPSKPKLFIFPHFFEFREFYNTQTIKFSPFSEFQEFPQHSN